MTDRSFVDGVNNLTGGARRGQMPQAVQLAWLVRELLARETAPGGPYKDDTGVVAPRLNAAIADLFVALKSPLPNLEKYRDHNPAIRPARHVKARSLTETQSKAKAIIGGIRGPLRSHADRAYRRIITADRKGEISSIGCHFATSLPLPVVDQALATVLGVANLMVWTAYTIFDDFIDGKGDPAFLSVANVAHRCAAALYMNAAPVEIADMCARVFDGMDEANAWELAHCRFATASRIITIGPLPRYGNHAILAARSRAHVLGPLIIAARTGIDQRKVACALDHYLIARQLNDDLHDWSEDFMRGHISPIVVRLITAAGVGPGTYDTAALHQKMKDAFWQGELTAASRYALHHISKARRSLMSIGMPEDSDFIRIVIAPIEASLVDGIRRHESDKAFLRAYRSPIAPASTIAR